MLAINLVPLLFGRFLLMKHSELDDEVVNKKYSLLYEKKSTDVEQRFNLVLSPMAFFYRRFVFMLAMVLFFDYPVFQMIAAQALSLA